MRSLATCSVLLLLLVGMGNARAAEPSDEVMSREKQWAAALITAERATLEQMLGDEFALTSAAGATPRTKWMATVGKWQTKAADLRDGWSVKVYGDVAIARGIMFWHVLKDAPDPRTGSKEIKGDFSLLDVWVRRSGRWQVVARHSILLPSPTP